MKSCKIVLTGEPCSGKTESLNYLKQRLINSGKSVITIEETANSLLALGYMPNNNISTFDFQNLLFKIQFLKEYLNGNRSDLILCDRGLLDGKVYIDEDFQEILNQNKVDEQLICSTYDMALYFKSIAFDYPEEFASKRIYESPEIGMLRDERCRDIWRQKIIPCNYDNFDGFDAKQARIYSSLENQLNSYKVKNVHNLSDYYNDEHVQFLFSGINTIMQNNEISNDVKIKTRRLIK